MAPLKRLKEAGPLDPPPDAGDAAGAAAAPPEGWMVSL